MSTAAPVPEQQKEPSEREQFYRFAKAYITARDDGGYITAQAARLLLNYLKACMAKLPKRKRNLEELTRVAIDRCPVRRIDLDALEKYELVMRSDEYAVSATGDEFEYKKLLQEAIIEGIPKVLVEWKPTWEPVGNIPKTKLKAFRDKKRGKRKIQRRAKKLVADARK